MSAIPTTADAARAPAAPQTQPATAGWILSPSLDLLLLANLTWPLIALLYLFWPTLTGSATPAGQQEPLSIVQVYLLSAPHRLITVPMVLFDKRHMQNWGRFAVIAAGLTGGSIALALLGIYLPYGTTTLIYLMTIDFAWNAWHFASQHAGISRIYGRKCHPGDSLDELKNEKAAIRIMVLWTFLRVGMWHGSQDVTNEIVIQAARYAAWIDPIAFIAPAILMVKEVRRANAASWGRLFYMGSVVALYGSMLVMLRFGGRGLVGLLVAHACFHSIEYFAVIGWAASKKRGGAWDVIAPRAAAWTVFFVAIVGAINYGVASWDMYWWGLITLMVSYIHYAWDGMIWKAPTSRASTSPA